MMPNALDAGAVATALAGFVLFLVAHVVVLRRHADASAFKVLVISCGLFGVLDAALWSWLMLVGQPGTGYEVPDMAVAALASLALYGLLCFDYVIGWFNLGETARRIRLLRELARAPRHTLTEDELLRVYNADLIVRARLARLVSSGQLRLDGERYKLNGRVFLRQAQTLALLKTLIPPPGGRTLTR
jgi:hypothetical protein